MSNHNLVSLVDQSLSKFSHEPAIKYFSKNYEIVVDYNHFKRLCEPIADYLTLLKNNGSLCDNSFIGIYCEVTFTYPCIIYSILKAGLAFVPLDPMNGSVWNKQIIDSLNMKVVLFNRKSDFLIDTTVINCVKLLEENVEFRLIARNEVTTVHSAVSMAYSVQSSGTTGLPKIIKVPHKAIVPNIIDLSCLFKVTSEDVVFLSSPPTFDPSIVDIFLALSNGAALLIVDNPIKKDVTQLLDILFPPLGRVSVLQITPSLFKRWSDDEIRSRVLGEASKLRILAFGGEKCPGNEILEKWNVPDHIGVFNLYGISEVSCWAAVTEVKLKRDEMLLTSSTDNSSICDKTNQSFTLPMSETVLQVRNLNEDNIGEMFVGSSSRICYIDDEEDNILDGSVIFRSTGDLFKVNGDIYYFVSRKKDEVKRYGIRLNLKSVEALAERDPLVHQAACLWFPSKSDCGILALFIVPTDQFCLNVFKKKIKDNFFQGAWPDVIKVVSSIPVTKHGKVDENFLSKQLINERKYNDPYKLFESLWINYTTCTEVLKDKGFISSGGTSFSALQFITELQQFTDVNYDFISYLIQDKYYEDCVKDFSRVKIVNSNVNIRNEIDHSEDISLEKNYEYSMAIRWSHDLGKCVDASPAYCNIDNVMYIVIGSHSGKIVVLNSDGTNISEVRLPDRIESTASINPILRQFVIGCYDCCIYLFTLDCKLIWSFKTADIVKSSPIIYKDCVICGSYDKFVYCINSSDGKLLWKRNVSGQVLSKIQIINAIAVVATLGGTVESLLLKDGTPIWSCEVGAPIFANFLILNETIIVADVKGSVHWISVDSGHEKYEFKSDGNIFSSLVHHDTNVLYGSTEGYVYALNSTNATLDWKIRLDGRIISAPLIIKQCDLEIDPSSKASNSDIIAITCSKGVIYLFDCTTRREIASLNLPGEVFSSPMFVSGNIIVGCRDNNVYSLVVRKSC